MNFCTLFNSYYLHKGIATYLSLERTTDDFHLYVLAFDHDCYDKLTSFHFKHMTVELLDDFETPELLAIKPGRNMAEYCWTCSAACTDYFMEKYDLPSITYLDADLYFFNSPKVLFDEIGDASIALSEHWFDTENKRAGRFCVQFVYFRNDEEGRSALHYWKDSCLKWCFARYEDGKFGDQSYIEDIYRNYRNVHVIENRGCGIAEWNDNNYTYTLPDKLTYNGTEYQAVFYHMHGIKIDINNKVLEITTPYIDINPKVIEFAFKPFCELVMEIYSTYLGREVTSWQIITRPLYKRLFSMVKDLLHDSRFARFIYYNILNVKYNGHEKSKQ